MHQDFTPNNFRVVDDCVYIEITGRRRLPTEALIDSGDLERVINAGRWTRKSDGYIYCPRLRTYLHRFILDAPNGSVVDHLNHSVGDCRRSNLRIASHAENMQNRSGASRASKSGHRGVFWDSQYQKWRVEVQANGVVHRLGRFDDLAQAASVADLARDDLHR